MTGFCKPAPSSNDNMQKVRTDDMKVPMKLLSFAILGVFVSTFNPIIDRKNQKSHPNASIISRFSGPPLPYKSQKQRRRRFSPPRPRTRAREKRVDFPLTAPAPRLPTLLSRSTPPPQYRRRPSTGAAPLPPPAPLLRRLSTVVGGDGAAPARPCSARCS